MNELKAKLVDIFAKTEEAYRFSFPKAELRNTDWAIWYADFLHQPLQTVIDTNLTQAEIVTCLIAAEEERLAMHGPDQPWEPLYADHFITRFAPADPVSETSLSLYYYPECPFCARVLHAIQQTGANVELRHVWDEPKYRNELQEARGRTTVPVLRISTKDGADRWMPESSDIVRYLHNRMA